MNQKQVNRIIKLLKDKDVYFDKGLSDKEIERINEEFGINFPDDLKLFLQTELPVSSKFINWRYALNSKDGKEEALNRLNGPKEGILFAIKYNSFWFDKWGNKPSNFEEQKRIMEKELDKQPKLIPIYSHRYIPDFPNDIGNPIFSVRDTDIIEYGNDLIGYFANEFSFELPKSYGEINKSKRICFWSDLVDLNC